MDMKDNLKVIQEGITVNRMARGDIPELDLYVDQITTLLDGKLADNKRTPDEKLITKTMVNNYSKEGLLKRIKGKKYSKEHILMMLMIYHLKQALTIQDISRVLKGIDEEIAGALEGYDPQTVARLYDTQLTAAEAAGARLPDFIQAVTADMDLKDDALEAAAMIMALTNAANLCRRAAEAIIDQTFPAPTK